MLLSNLLIQYILIWHLSDLTSSYSRIQDPINYKEAVFKLTRNKTNQNYHLVKSALTDQIIVNGNDLHRIDTLGRFLAAKIFQYTDKINMMIVPEFRTMIDNPILLLNYDQDNVKVNPKSTIIGTKSCSLVEIAYLKPKEPARICPWHWIMAEREDKYPFTRANAKCNCQNCLSKTIYDSDFKRLSSCEPEFALMPALHRESSMNKIEKWVFKLEEVPVACVCSIRLNPVF